MVTTSFGWPARAASVRSAAWMARFTTMGAPQRCVTPCSAKPRSMASAVTSRRHTFVAPTAAVVDGKPQPLQWNMGSVQRYRAEAPMPPASMELDSAWM